VFVKQKIPSNAGYNSLYYINLELYIKNTKESAFDSCQILKMGHFM
jgi:hypothetical protein